MQEIFWIRVPPPAPASAFRLLQLIARGLIHTPILASAGRPVLALCSLGLLLSGVVTLAAGEFPDSWTWDDKPADRAAHAALEGKRMAAFHVKDWINGRITAADIKGKVVVVDLYATWCGPCMRAIPQNNELLKKYKPDRVEEVVQKLLAESAR